MQRSMKIMTDLFSFWAIQLHCFFFSMCCSKYLPIVNTLFFHDLNALFALWNMRRDESKHSAEFSREKIFNFFLESNKNMVDGFAKVCFTEIWKKKMRILFLFEKWKKNHEPWIFVKIPHCATNARKKCAKYHQYFVRMNLVSSRVHHSCSNCTLSHIT